MEIAYSDAIKIESDFEVGEELSEPIYMSDFGRREILAIRQNLVSKIQDYEKSLVFQKYKEKVGEIVVGEVYQPWNKEILILDEEKIELVLPKAEQIPSDRFRKGDTVRAVVLKVEMRNNNPVIVLSRTSPIFLERLLEAEVPEIYDGLITIRNIVRIPGERAKIAVESYDAQREYRRAELYPPFGHHGAACPGSCQGFVAQGARGGEEGGCLHGTRPGVACHW